jgi:septum formation protein
LADAPPPGGGLPLVLASASPQRREILARLGVDFEVRPADVPELDSGEPAQVALHNARVKAHAVARPGERELVIGCDTIVCLDGTIHGKPADEAAARATLRALSGATHEVLSGLVLLAPDEERSALARTAVTFRALDDGLLDWYLATGEWRGRSGAYAIQKAGAALVRSIEGEGENVVGLPLASLLDLYPQLLLR